jgi:hypothetical protein
VQRIDSSLLGVGRNMYKTEKRLTYFVWSVSSQRIWWTENPGLHNGAFHRFQHSVWSMNVWGMDVWMTLTRNWGKWGHWAWENEDSRGWRAWWVSGSWGFSVLRARDGCWVEPYLWFIGGGEISNSFAIITSFSLGVCKCSCQQGYIWHLWPR